MFNFVEQFLNGRDSQVKGANRFHNPLSTKIHKVVKRRGVSFDSSLVNSLKKGNEDLLENFARALQDGFESGNFSVLCQQLTDFKVQFQNHILMENVKVFAYLEQVMKQDSSLLIKLHDARKEINLMSTEVINFCKKYSCPVGTLNLCDSFRAEFQQVGMTLIHRMEVVESDIYSLYSKIQ